MHQLLGANLWLDGKPGANISTEKIKAGSLGHGHFEQNMPSGTTPFRQSTLWLQLEVDNYH
jgi:hypothetical protein